MALKILSIICSFSIVFSADVPGSTSNLKKRSHDVLEDHPTSSYKKAKSSEPQINDPHIYSQTRPHDIFTELQTQNLSSEQKRRLTLELYDLSGNAYNLSAQFHLAKALEFGLLNCDQSDRGYLFLMEGTSHEMDHRVIKIYQNLYLKDHVPAIVRLAKIYSRPESYNKDFLIFYLTKAAELNDPEANFFLATLYHTATHAEQNGALALKHYTIASNLGFAEATYRLAEIYRSGILVKKSMSRAYELYQKAADQGSFKAMVQVLTQRIVHGDNVTDCIEKLYTLHQKGIIEATYILGTFYESTTYSGLLYDTDKAFSFFHNAARRNHAKSQYIIGSYYHKGIAPEQSHTDYPMLAEEFNLEVDNLLPIHRFESPPPLLTDGDFSWEILPSQRTLQFRKAVFWLKKSAENGHIPAKFLLARILLNSSTEVFDQQQSKDLLESIPHQGLIRLLINYMDKNPE
jgi:TPR repeat protein